MRVIEPPGPDVLSETPEQFIERLAEPVVITTRVDKALEDCLCYVLSEG